MKGTIVVIGAGIGGLETAYLLGKMGYAVTVYEKSKEEKISYEWYDDVSPTIFKSFGIPFPDEKTYFEKIDWSFVAPNSQMVLEVIQEKEKRDYSFDRIPLSKHFIKRAKEFATINFETEVDSLIIEDECIKGIVVNGKKIMADLVIDCSGALSKFRESLPASYNIEKQPSKGELFYAYRVFYERNKEAEAPKFTHKAYLKHLGEEGISWSRHDFPDEVDLLVGRTYKLDKEIIDRAVSELKKENPTIGEKIVHGGIVCTIPVRRPITKMVADNYVLIGDSAFMTIPMMGSGIASSILAAHILAETLENGEFSKENLWKYQVKFYHELGAKFMGIDVLKNWLITANSDDIRYLFENGIIDENDMRSGVAGELVQLPIDKIIKKALKGYRKLGTLLELNGKLNMMNKAVKLGNKIPSEYKEEEINKWSAKINTLFSK
jgi:flavin-dependent dehydrogenase